MVDQQVSQKSTLNNLDGGIIELNKRLSNLQSQLDEIVRVFHFYPLDIPPQEISKKDPKFKLERMTLEVDECHSKLDELQRIVSILYDAVL